MFKKTIIKIKPILLNLLKKIEQLEQTMSFQQRIGIKKAKIIKLPEKLVFFIFILVLFVSIFIKILWFEKHFSFILIFFRLLSLIILLYLINEIIFQHIKNTFSRIIANFKNDSKKNFVIFWTIVILNIVIVLLYTINSLSFYLLPIAGVVILVGILLGTLYGTIFILLNAFIISFFYYTGDGRIYLYILFYFLSSLYALGLAEKIYSRKDIFKAIIKSIVFNFIFSFLIEILISNITDIFNLKFSYKLLFKDDIHIFGLLINNFLSGFLSFSILSIFLPPFETIYQKITNIKLVELSDFSNPLLKRLMSEAPGTYHHSIIVSTLTENVALKLGQNSLLCKVASLYHDIGKLIKPEYFIENQSFLRSPDIEINPSLSALVIINHVKEGVKLAYEHKLDQEIIDIIEQHHGNSVIYGLYDKNLELNLVNKDLMRYPGPKPQSKEAAIIMICDSCEAACRSIKEPDAQKIKQTVESVINTKFIDGQFDETPLTLRDLYIISNIVTQMLISLYHLRTRRKEIGQQ
ncbi:MAG: HDIG domain-containing protein [Endomicrobia bacterium]|nr:HDIG domain-containing protein [Endomicrobiia bacterium]